MPENTTEETRQPSVESVTAENNRLQGELDTTKSQLATAKQQLADAKEKLAVAKSQQDTLKGELATTKTDLKAAKAVIDGQAEALKNAESVAAASDLTIVTYKGQQYRVVGKQFKVKGEVVKAEDLAKNEEALKYLVESKSGLLVPITKAEASK